MTDSPPNVILDSESESEQNEGEFKAEVEKLENIENLPAVPNEITFDGIPGQEIQELDNPEMPMAQQELMQ
jgi:hypothetical protein